MSKVCEFFSDNRKERDETKLEMHFSTEDTRIILNTRILQVCTKDRIAWIHSSDGQYTVSSGYQRWCQNQSVNVEVQQSRGWSKIWQLEIPHRIKVFLWRFCLNTVPIRNLLRGRGVPVTIGCSMCVGEVEHLRHLFFECSFAKECWQQVGINVDMWDVENAPVWLLHNLDIAPDDILIKISTVLWGVWFARNKRIFENRNLPTFTVMSWSKKQIIEWQVANKKSSTATGMGGNRQRNEYKWHPPEADCLKINVDASVIAGQNYFAVGMVLRNHQGQYLGGKTMRFAGMVSVLEAELTGITEALSWSQEIAGGSVVIESDSLLSVNAVNNQQVNLLELGDLLNQCSTILRSNVGLSVGYVRKQANKVAHKIARFPCELNSFVVNPSPPMHLLETLLSDSLVI